MSRHLAALRNRDWSRAIAVTAFAAPFNVAMFYIGTSNVKTYFGHSLSEGWLLI